MKLNIGQNIRTLRRAADMTQDELAVKLGVAFQTVSRWENGGTYPDMELLPAIAGVFGVTVDHLLGSNGEEREKQLKDLIKRIKNAVRNRENDTVVALLREVRRDLRQYRGFGQDFRGIWNALRWYGAEATPEILEEARLFFAEY
ncbi:MAG: helix-turn-helix transcriptional regulator, partial [Clostridia bacterium]|nr:helix-turn-helix transcriptional regulator [Clostridia bacterium]